MRLLCFVLISSDLIGNSPVSNNRTRQKYDRLAWEGARDTKCVLNYHGAREHISCFLVKSQMRFQGRNGAHVIVPRCTAGDHGLSSFTIPLRKILSNFQLFSSENLIKLSTFLFQLLLQWGVSPWCFKPLSNKTGRNEWWRRRPYTISKRTWVLSL